VSLHDYSVVHTVYEQPGYLADAVVVDLRSRRMYVQNHYILGNASFFLDQYVASCGFMIGPSTLEQYFD